MFIKIAACLLLQVGVVNAQEPSVVFKEVSSDLRLQLGGDPGCWVTRQVEGGTGEGNQSDRTLHFGLGDDRGPINIEIFWANRTKQSITGVETNDLLTVEIGSS